VTHQAPKNGPEVNASVRRQCRRRVFSCPLNGPSDRLVYIYDLLTRTPPTNDKHGAAQFGNKSAAPAALDTVVNDMLRGGGHRGPDRTFSRWPASGLVLRGWSGLVAR